MLKKMKKTFPIKIVVAPINISTLTYQHYINNGFTIKRYKYILYILKISTTLATLKVLLTHYIQCDIWTVVI